MSDIKFLDDTGLSTLWNKIKSVFLQKHNGVGSGSLQIYADTNEDGSVEVYGDDTQPASVGVYNRDIAGTMHLNMDTLGTKELVVYDSNGNRSTVVGQDASGNYFGDVFDSSNSVYDNTNSGLSATDVQSAVDEIAQSIGTGNNYVVITYTTTKNSYDSGVVSSDFTKTSIVDQDGNAVSDGDVFDLIFDDGYGARLALVYHNTTYTIEMSHKVFTVPSGYSLSFPLFDVKISNNPAIIRTEVDVTFTGNVFSLIYEEYDYAPLHSPAFTGSPTAPTPTTGDDSTKIATTAFVKAAIDALSYHKGNIVDLRNSVFAGVFTGGQKSIVFYIPLNKPLASDISSVALVNTSVEVRHSDGGYIIASNEGGLSDHGTISCAINYSRTGVLVTLTLTTADTRYANNTPIAVRGYGTFTITFR